MRVRMLIAMSGSRDGEDWPPVGGEIDITPDEAVTYIPLGYCVSVAPVVETAAAEPVAERAVVRRGRPKG
jgi:hypothetical protein